MVAPRQAYDISAGRSFTVFIGASIAPMPESEAARIIQNKLRAYALQREKKVQRKYAAAAAVITSKVSKYLARKALQGAQNEIERARKDGAAIRLQAFFRMRCQRNTIASVRTQKVAAARRALAEATYHGTSGARAKSKAEGAGGGENDGVKEKKRGTKNRSKESNEVTVAQDKLFSSKRAGGGHTSNQSSPRKPARSLK